MKNLMLSVVGVMLLTAVVLLTTNKQEEIRVWSYSGAINYLQEHGRLFLAEDEFYYESYNINETELETAAVRKLQHVYSLK